MTFARMVVVRLALGLLTIVAASAVIYVGTDILPGDPARAALGRDATEGQIAALREEFGLDRPLVTRYAEWLAGVGSGDFGRSFPSGESVNEALASRFYNSAALAVVTLLLGIPFSLVLGILSALHRNSVFDHGVTGSTVALIAIPEFVVGSLLIAVFAVWLRWLPPASLIDPSRPLLSNPEILVLPVVVLLAASLAQTVRMIRGTMVDELDAPYVELARLKGVPDRDVVMRHALRNGIGVSIQIYAQMAAWILGGVIIVEAVFEYRGVGLALINAVNRRDLPTVQAIALIITGVYVTVNVLADLIVMFLNPRLRNA